MSADRAGDPKGVTPAMIEAAERWIAEASARPPRWKLALRVLLNGESLTARLAAKEYGDWNFRETIDELKRRGVQLRVRPELSFSAIGPIVLRPRLVRAYTLRPESRELAAELLADVGAEK